MKGNIGVVMFTYYFAFPLREYIEPQSGYDRSSHRVAMTDRATEWLDAVPARDAVPREGKVPALAGG